MGYKKNKNESRTLRIFEILGTKILKLIWNFENFGNLGYGNCKNESRTLRILEILGTKILEMNPEF